MLLPDGLVGPSWVKAHVGLVDFWVLGEERYDVVAEVAVFSNSFEKIKHTGEDAENAPISFGVHHF